MAQSRWLVELQIEPIYNAHARINVMIHHGQPQLRHPQVQLTNLQTMYEKGKATSDQRRQLELEYQDWARLQGRGPHTAGRRPWAQPPP